jgi:hypothetical protein
MPKRTTICTPLEVRMGTKKITKKDGNYDERGGEEYSSFRI